MKEKKSLFLFVALLLPIAIFLFLKQFGKNEFDVPVFYEQGQIVAPSDCNFTYTVPYRVADTLMSMLGADGSDSLYVLYLDEAGQTAVNRISHEFSSDPVQIVPVSQQVKVNQQVVRDCALLMAKNTSIVLIDHKNRIRGYYDGSDRDEVDRLLVEVEIILKYF